MPKTAWQGKSVELKSTNQVNGTASKGKMLRAIAYWSLRKSGSGHGSAKYKGGTKHGTLTKQKDWLKKNNAKQLRKYKKERNARFGSTSAQRTETTKFNAKSKRNVNKANKIREKSGLSKIKTF